MRQKDKKKRIWITIGIATSCILLLTISLLLNQKIYPGENILKDIM